MPSAYRRVTSDDHNTDNRRDQFYQPPASSSSSTKSRAERISDKIQAFLWVCAATAVAHYTSTPQTLLSSPLINRPIFNVAVVLLGINTVLMMYLAVYLPRFRGIKNASAWEVYCPRVIPIMTGVGIVASFLLIRATWPVWGFLSPLILGVEFLGFLFALHFVPWL
mmetsp:Transcript_7022/g.8748  ORF Transcript_7022/g.8748 Transcript_7022/m.8748 type:complete len:166 (-) Transcript_7022:199-696(-)